MFDAAIALPRPDWRRLLRMAMQQYGAGQSAVQDKQAQHYGALQASTAASTLLTGLSAAWLFDEATGATRLASVSDCDLSDTGTVNREGAWIGSSARVASGKYLSCASDAAIQSGNIDFTWSLWVNNEGATFLQGVFSKSLGNTQDEYALYTYLGTYQFAIANSSKIVNSTVTPRTGRWDHIIIWHDAAADTINIQVNGGAVKSAATAGVAPTASAYTLYFGKYGTVPFTGRLSQPCYWKRVLTSDERAELWNGGAGAMYPFTAIAFGDGLTFAPSDLWDNGYTTDLGDYYYSNCFAHYRFTTAARQLRLTTYDNILAVAGDPASGLNIRVDDANWDFVPATAAGANTLYCGLPPGAKTVDISAGAQGKPSGTILGHYLKSLAISSYTAVAQVTASRLVIYGDSISVGERADSRYSALGWTILTRNGRGTSVSTMVEGYGMRKLQSDCANDSARTAFVSRLAGYSPTTIWMAIGTNDFGLSLWSAANFGTAYADFLDKLHAAAPSLIIYCQSPIYRTDEATPNTHGNTLADYRSQISAACAARSGWTTYIDGSAILGSGDLYTDGIHPTEAGHAKYYLYVKGILGF